MLSTPQVSARNQDPDLSRAGELHRIAQYVDQYLAQPGGIADNGLWNALFDIISQGQALFLGNWSHQINSILNALFDIKRLDFQLHLAAIDLREVQDIIDDC